MDYVLICYRYYNFDTGRGLEVCLLDHTNMFMVYDLKKEEEGVKESLSGIKNSFAVVSWCLVLV